MPTIPPYECKTARTRLPSEMSLETVERIRATSSPKSGFWWDSANAREAERHCWVTCNLKHCRERPEVVRRVPGSADEEHRWLRHLEGVARREDFKARRDSKGDEYVENWR